MYESNPATVRERFSNFLTALREERPAMEYVGADSSAAAFLRRTCHAPAERGHGQVRIQYADADLAVLTRRTVADAADINWLVVGIDRFHPTGIVGVPFPPWAVAQTGAPDSDEAGDSVAFDRFRLLRVLRLASWPAVAVDEDLRAAFRAGPRRLQGRVGVARTTREYLARIWTGMSEDPVPDGSLFCSEQQAKEVRVGAQTVQIAAAMDIAVADAAKRRQAPKLLTAVKLVTPCRVRVNAPGYDERTFTFPAGRYLFAEVGRHGDWPLSGSST